jgi:5-deoxy-glucuronate isomerase
MDTRAELAPDTAGWSFLAARVVRLAAGEQLTLLDPLRESAVVLVEGGIDLGGALSGEIRRPSPFTSVAAAAYLPPSESLTVTATVASEVAVGAAPATGILPPALIDPGSMPSVLRGERQARRQVVSVLADPIPAERLIVYEAWIPRGCWAGWPPHRHDGEHGSPYLEETYYFRFDRDAGFGVHRNFAEDFDETIAIRDGSLVAVPRGYHVCGASPAANLWVLNFLAGDPADRARPPFFDPAESGIQNDWLLGELQLPAVEPGKDTMS